jgi:Family of unknown function (DUF5677)
MASADERGKTKPMNEQAKAAARALVDLVRTQHLPKRFRREPPWHSVAAASVVRIADTVESILTLWEGKDALGSKNDLDMMILLRVLYEQTVVFAWLAIDPEAHMDEWGDNERYYHRVLVEEAAEYGIPCTWEELTARGKKLKPMDQLARAVDEHWGGVLTGFRAAAAKGKKQQIDLLNFAGLYLPIYREASATAHATPASLAPYMDLEVWPRVVHVASGGRFAAWWSMVVPLYSQALIICNSVLGWPDLDTVLGINNGMYPTG